MLIAYSAKFASYSHIYGFFACSSFMYFLIKYEEKYQSLNSLKKIGFDILSGTILGLICLIRLSNIMIVFLYIFWGVNSLKTLRSRFREIFSGKIFYQIFAFLIVYSIQIALYGIYNGHFTFHGYNSNEEQFIYLFHPQIYKVLFSANKGLFIYCPVLFLGFLGMFLFDFKNNKFKISQPLIFMCLTFVVSSWWCRWLGMGYSGRMYCDFLCIFALPVANIINTAFEDIKNKKNLFAYFLPVIIISFVLINLIWYAGVSSESINSNLATWYMLKNHLFSCLHF